MMREATTVQMNTTDIPGVVRLASKDFNITEEESTGVLQRLIEGKRSDPLWAIQCRNTL